MREYDIQCLISCNCTDFFSFVYVFSIDELLGLTACSLRSLNIEKLHEEKKKKALYVIVIGRGTGRATCLHIYTYFWTAWQCEVYLLCNYNIIDDNKRP